MNEKSLGEVTLALPVSEFVDRFLISALKLDKFKRAGSSNTEQLQKWIEHHQDAFTNILNFSKEVRLASDQLAKVHAQLWGLEDLVRSPEATEIEFFCANSQKDFFIEY